MRHLGHDYSYKKFAHSEVEKVLQRFGSTWDGMKNYKNVMAAIKLWMKKKLRGCDFL